MSRWLQVAAHALPAGVDSPLGKRLAGLTFLRLIVLALFLATTELYWARNTPFGGFSSMTGLATAGVAFTLSAIYATLLRHGRRLHVVAHAQLITDQLTWTIIVYLSGGITSGATSLYGLTCLSGAILLDTHGAITAALSGTFCYSTLCAAFTYHLISPPLDQPQAAFVVDSSEMVYPVFSTLMAIATVSVLGAYLAERLRSFGGRLEAATKKAEQAEHLAALGRLAAGLAHEIRNPLGSIRGSIELLRTGGSLADEDSRLCAIVEREVARLNDLVGDMIDLSRPRTPELAESDLAATARAVVELAAGSARGSEVSVRYEGPRSLLVRADSDQMRQVLWNLVRNAMQASAAGDEVCVRLEHERNHDAIMEVRDHGPGVAENAREHLFDAFFTTRARGAGIGLAVVKRVIDSHDFSIEVDSSGGKGTTFRVRIPPAHVLILAASLLLAVGCGSGRSWIDQGRLNAHEQPEGDSWSDPAPAVGTASATSATRSPSTTAPAASPRSTPAPTDGGAAPVTIALQGRSGAYRNTYYDFPQDRAVRSGAATRQLFNEQCALIQTVSQEFHDALCVQGSGRLINGKTVSFARRDCECAATCPRTEQKICFDVLDPKLFPHGRGARGTAITPTRTVAVDPKTIPLGTVLYIPQYHGLRDLHGVAHDGCFIAEDRGLKVKGQHVDIFTGNPRLTQAWNRAVPSNAGVQVVVGASRCAYLTKD